jgi:phosphohistidine phosphatase
MKQLFIIRHGKASKDLMPDIKRPLIDKGIKRTEKHAQILKDHHIKPDLIISSPAVRAFQTSEILAETLNYDQRNILINQLFYFYPQEDVLKEIKAIPDDYQTVFIVGHNPLWTELADRFSENGLWHLRTSGVMGLEIDTDQWQNFDKAKKTNKILIN